ncbi:MAG: hypothetical protein AB7V42_02170 [Thermoleophilia bacterium]
MANPDAAPDALRDPVLATCVTMMIGSGIVPPILPLCARSFGMGYAAVEA